MIGGNKREERDGGGERIEVEVGMGLGRPSRGFLVVGL